MMLRTLINSVYYYQQFKHRTQKGVDHQLLTLPKPVILEIVAVIAAFEYRWF